MREIKFRGMEVFDKKWVYGWLANIAATSDKRNNKGWRIIENISDGNVYTPVIPDTVGEFAGLSDINGKEIYEGDIVLIPYNHIGNIVVSYKNGRYNISQYKCDEGEVIGNIYENPEMVSLENEINDLQAELLRRFDAMKCCGNCQWSISRNCKDWQRYRDCGSYPALDSYCDKWQSDGLSREEREGK